MDATLRSLAERIERTSYLTTMSVADEHHLKALRLLAATPDMSQRELAEALGVSVGKTNYCIRALVDKGLLKVNNFRNGRNKLAYAYLFTPAGIAATAELTTQFLKRKRKEYEVLSDEIDQLQHEVGRVGEH